MAVKGIYNGIIIGITNNSGVDIAPYRFVKLAEGTLGYASDGDLNWIGVTLPEKRTSDQAIPNGMVASVVLNGIVEVECGGNISEGSLVKLSTNGKVVACTGETDEISVGIALDSGSSGNIIPVLIRPIYISTGLIS